MMAMKIFLINYISPPKKGSFLSKKHNQNKVCIQKMHYSRNKNFCNPSKTPEQENIQNTFQKCWIFKDSELIPLSKYLSLSILLKKEKNSILSLKYLKIIMKIYLLWSKFHQKKKTNNKMPFLILKIIFLQ